MAPNQVAEIVILNNESDQAQPLENSSAHCHEGGPEKKINVANKRQISLNINLSKNKTCCSPGATCNEAELLSALTMLSVIIFSLNFMLRCEKWTSAVYIALTYSLHCPFAMIHHLNLGLGDPNEGQVKIGLVYRRLDYTCIQLDSLVSILILSQSNILSILSVLVNLYFIVRIWLHQKRPQEPNFTYQGIGAFGVVLGIISKGAYFDALMAMLGFYLCFDLVFFERLGHKYSHGAMHLALVVPFFFIFHASSPEMMSWHSTHFVF
mmetsp:Transcript_7235/g.9669  ORF Transcript_7235/g.9669 Transcript_7235/m.9669 type:complete len:266 (-) Transcript_7235:207-1004(-)